jgi:L-ascorbate metabolism protein UlaG (beta-lactamase superfamily)
MKRKILLLVLGAALIGFGFTRVAKLLKKKECDMKIRWFGHACFLLEAEDGTKVITDPFDESVGYRIPEEKPDIVTVSHNHFDHNAVDLLQGNPEVVKDVGEREIKGIIFKGIKSFHDKSRGAERGTNTIFVFALDGVRLCHLGDLGHLLSSEQQEEIGEVDVLFIPVGGTFTIDGREAREVSKQLNPKLIIPMHYKTESCSIGIDSYEKFLKGFEKVERATEWRGNKESLPSEQTVLVLEYAK